MPKRARNHDYLSLPNTKRQYVVGGDQLSRLSDELLLRILSFLPVETLVVVQRVSQKFHAVAGDGQLWKAAYYNRFVRPRAIRLPGMKDAGNQGSLLSYSSKTSKWLDEDHLTKRETATNWKRQYKLRHNWSQGSCSVSEIAVSGMPAVETSLLRYWSGVVFTVDAMDGLRAWSTKPARRLIASLPLGTNTRQEAAIPTSLAVDELERAQTISSGTKIAVGFEDGSFALYFYSASTGRFTKIYEHARSSNGRITAIALSSPYLFSMTESRLLSIYSLAVQVPPGSTADAINTPSLLHSLRSHTASTPLSLSIRRSGEVIVATVAYTVTTYLSGYSVGVQEMRLTTEGILLESRLATSDDRTYYPLRTPSYAYGTVGSEYSAWADRSSSTPTSLSYTHPYLLVAHPDNTLTLYLVTSNLTGLRISAGSRLWGHTSSVSGAYIGGRGRAISVSSLGDELRVWELEGGLTSITNRKRLSSGRMSIRISPESGLTKDLSSLNAAIARRGTGLGLALDHRSHRETPSVTAGWVGFDEENVVVLRQKGEGKQALVVYDFT